LNCRISTAGSTSWRTSHEVGNSSRNCFLQRSRILKRGQRSLIMKERRSYTPSCLNSRRQNGRCEPFSVITSIIAGGTKHVLQSRNNHTPKRAKNRMAGEISKDEQLAVIWPVRESNSSAGLGRQTTVRKIGRRR